MMNANIRLYNWRDIMRLVYKDCGLETEEEIRTKSEALVCGWLLGNDVREKDTCLEVRVFDKPYSERLEDHVGGD